jgi:hypothetical protein
MLTALDAVATVVLLALVVRMVRDGLDPGESWVAGFVAVVLLVGWAATLYARRGTWRYCGSDMTRVLDLAIRRCRASILLARINQAAILLGVAVGLVARFGDVSFPALDTVLTESTRWRLRLLAALLFIAWLGGAEWYARRKQAERHRLEALRSQLLAEARD